MPATEPDDDLLLARLGALADLVDPVPDHVRLAARAVFAFRDPDAALMAAVAVDAGQLEAVRGTAPASRMHFFELGGLSVDVELTVAGAFGDLVGVVADPDGVAGTTVTVETVSASSTTETAADGRFAVSRVPAGLVRLVLARPDRPRVSTGWFDTG